MNTTSNTISVTYSDERLRTLVEEYITMQKREFTFQGLCSYVLYWAKEEGKTAIAGLYESNEIDVVDCARLTSILEKIISEGRLTVSTEDNRTYIKSKE